MSIQDDELEKFEEEGAAALPTAAAEGHVLHDGAQIWYASYGAGPTVILLHGGLGHSGNWGYQVPALVESGYHVLLVDSRGHGRSTRDERPYTYHLMASDLLAVMDTLQIEKAALVGWSDGACIALVLASQTPERVHGVFFFGCNMDPSGTKEVEFSPILRRCMGRHSRDYALLSATPDQFDVFSHAVGLMMQTEPNYTPEDLAQLDVPVTVVQSEHDEFIKPEHAEYLAKTLPNAELILLRGVSHFAPLQRPDLFNETVITFLRQVQQ